MPNVNLTAFDKISNELNKPIIEKRAEKLALAQLLYYCPDMFEDKQRIWNFQYNQKLKHFFHLYEPPSIGSIVTADDYKDYLKEKGITK